MAQVYQNPEGTCYPLGTLPEKGVYFDNVMHRMGGGGGGGKFQPQKNQTLNRDSVVRLCFLGFEGSSEGSLNWGLSTGVL